MTWATFKTVCEIFQSLVTIASILIGGAWVIYRFILQRERYPNINFDCDIIFIGKQNNAWIIEIMAVVENKGKAQHAMNVFEFTLDAIRSDEVICRAEQWEGQTDFPHPAGSGSFMKTDYTCLYIDPGTVAKYSSVLTIPDQFSFLLLSCMFKYQEKHKMHVAEKVVKVPYRD